MKLAIAAAFAVFPNDAAAEWVSNGSGNNSKRVLGPDNGENGKSTARDKVLDAQDKSDSPGLDIALDQLCCGTDVSDCCSDGTDCCGLFDFCSGGTCFEYNRRMLKEGEELNVKENLSIEERIDLLKAMKPFGASADASFSFKYDLISKKSCDNLVKYLDASLASDVASSQDIPIVKSPNDATGEKYDSWVPFAQGGADNQYNKKLYADQLVQLVGREDALNIIDYFEESLDGLTIDCMYIARHGESHDDLFMVPWHIDDYATVEITLNDDYEGGDVLHLNGDGIHKTHARPGSATAHKDDIVHGITPNKNAPKYMLILKHHFNRLDKQGVVRLSKDMVYDITDIDIESN